MSSQRASTSQSQQEIGFSIASSLDSHQTKSTCTDSKTTQETLSFIKDSRRPRSQPFLGFYGRFGRHRPQHQRGIVLNIIGRPRLEQIHFLSISSLHHQQNRRTVRRRKGISPFRCFVVLRHQSGSRIHRDPGSQRPRRVLQTRPDSPVDPLEGFASPLGLGLCWSGSNVGMLSR
ncbi:hypothetical protein BDY24DRAFT_380326 [Mrakia frigida]|uniref:uncharacterized protein n=1 Tax=Mrakia frigida TaxID=29902 RepID=UPI003FCC076D